jgi:hypothetical protein
MVVKAGIFISEPAVIHHKQFSSHIRYILHHLMHFRLINIKINSLPAVKQNIIHFSAMGELIFSAPFMKVAAYPTEAFSGKTQRKFRSDKTLAPCKGIIGVRGIYTCVKAMTAIISGLETQLIIT